MVLHVFKQGWIQQISFFRANIVCNLADFYVQPHLYILIDKNNNKKINALY